MASYGYDIARGLIPGRADYRLRGRVEGVGQFTGKVEARILKSRLKLYSAFPRNEMAVELKRVVNSLRESDPHLALDYLHALKGMTSQEQFIQNWTLPTEFIAQALELKLVTIARVFKGSEIC